MRFDEVDKRVAFQAGSTRASGRRKVDVRAGYESQREGRQKTGRGDEMRGGWKEVEGESETACDEEE
ncbi:hypothetical protein [Halarchaeum nitratireducens]|uniref:hypothetical protein n=1 Tax=Halarchaeum nitratireducens TaxID=489913 RepID=UPI001E5691E6|nr:hypothetical protein [Halarchaeum nitratireducens]